MDPKTIVEPVIEQLESAWNAADGAAYAAPFMPDADFVNVRGELHSGADNIGAGHQGIFNSIYAGSTVDYTVLQARELRRRRDPRPRERQAARSRRPAGRRSRGDRHASCSCPTTASTASRRTTTRSWLASRTTIGSMPDRLYFTESDDANALIASDPMALLVGFELDQRVTVMKAFEGPLALKERLGAIDAATLRVRRSRAGVLREACDPPLPALDGQAGARAGRPRARPLRRRCRARLERRDDSDELRTNLIALPGFGEMKIKSMAAVLFKHFGVEAARELVPWHPTLGDVDSPQALEDYQAAKSIHKAEWAKAREGQRS